MSKMGANFIQCGIWMLDWRLSDTFIVENFGSRFVGPQWCGRREAAIRCDDREWPGCGTKLPLATTQKHDRNN